MGFKFRVDQISHTLPTTRHRCNFDVWALAQGCGVGHRSLVTLKRVLSEYNEDFIFFNYTSIPQCCLNLYAKRNLICQTNLYANSQLRQKAGTV